MDAPLLPSGTRRTARLLRRLAALLLAGAGALQAAGCLGWTGGDSWMSHFDHPKRPADGGASGDQVQRTSAETKADDNSSGFDVSRLWNWHWHDWVYDDDNSPLEDSYVMQGDQTVTVKAPARGTPEARMIIAREAFRRQDYAKAERVFHRVADNEKNPPKLVEEAKFYEAESQRLQDDLPKAAATYTDLMNKFPRNPYREQALQHMYNIANFWLDDTREEMKEYDEKDQGKRWFVVPRFVSFEKTKPTFDREGRAIQLLEAVRFGDINGPLADKALYLCGSVKFFEEDFAEADHYFTQVAEKHKDSDMAEKAIKLAIASKHMSTGGPDYDGRKVAEARILVQRALENYPEMNKDGYLTGQLAGIAKQQAEKDFRMAEFYERTGHSGSAVWMYEIVVRRYPGTGVDKLAAERRDAILKKLNEEKSAAPAQQQQPPSPHNPNRTAIEQAPPPRALPPDVTGPR
jgi:outer membrane protein assembly factor BamD (BamD/ComL family)